MPTKTYHNHFTSVMEQRLIEDLVTEAIREYGHDCFYLPRTVQNRDGVLKESEYDRFDSAYMLEFYVKTTQQFAGEGALLSKFGIETNYGIVVTVPRRSFVDEVGSQEGLERPREGDLVFVPMTNAVYRVAFVDATGLFYPLGSLPVWDLNLELYESDGSIFNTGIPAVDDLFTPISEDILINAVKTEAGDLITDQRGWVLILEERGDATDADQNAELEDEADDAIDWSEDDPFSEGTRY